MPVQVTPAEELRKRAERLQVIMRRAGVDGVVATANADVFYLSGAIQQGQVYLPVQGHAVLMVRKHHGRARMISQLGEGRVVGVRSLKEMPKVIEDAGGRPKRIGFELDTLPYATFMAYSKALEGLGAELVDGSLLFKEARTIKSDFEVAQIRRASEVAEAAFQAAQRDLRPGISEVELASLVEAASRVAGHSGVLRMRAYGQEMHMGHLLSGETGALASFMNSPTGGLGTGPWAPYGAGVKTIHPGEPVLLDYTGEWGGYIADQTRMLSIGTLSSFWTDAFAAMLDVARYLEVNVKPGVISGEVYEMALRRATELGYGENFMGPPEEESPGQKVTFVGHGVGLELDEWPPLQKGTKAPIVEGMVLAIEPKLVFSGRGAIGIEDTYRVTTHGLVPITFSSREIAVV